MTPVEREPGSTTELSIFRGGPAYPLSLSLTPFYCTREIAVHGDSRLTREPPTKEGTRRGPSTRVGEGKKNDGRKLKSSDRRKGVAQARGFSKEITLSGRKEEIGSTKVSGVCREGKWILRGPENRSFAAF